MPAECCSSSSGSSHWRPQEHIREMATESIPGLPQSPVNTIHSVQLCRRSPEPPFTCLQGLHARQPQRWPLGPPSAWSGTAAMGGGFPLLASLSAIAYNKLGSHQSSPSRYFSLCTINEKAWGSEEPLVTACYRS